MIPLRLQIKNFLSYGSDIQEIDFTRYHLICLSGKNGHGKSALLDAITWAVWGQARKTSGQPKPDHGLLRLGQRNMKVVFDFEFNNHFYRVRREFTFAYGKPSTYLEFGMFGKEGDEVVPLTDKTIRKTQAKIELLLGLDYDSFINSAFIRQGNAGEFSQKSPKERKEILGSILGLGQYDSLRKLAAEKARSTESERQSLLKLHDRLMVDIEQKNNVQQVEQDLVQKCDAVKKQQDVCEKDLQDLKNKQQELSTILQQKLDTESKLQQLNFTYKTGLDKLVQLRTVWRQLLAKIKGTLNKKELDQQKLDLSKKLAGLRKKQQVAWKAKDQLLVLREQYQKIETKLFGEHDQKINKCKVELQKQQLIYDHKLKQQEVARQEYEKLVGEQKTFNEKLKDFAKLQKDQATLQKTFERYKEFYQRLVVVGNNAKYGLDDVVRKQGFVEHDSPSCPLCEQNLSAARKRFLAQQFDKQKSFSAHRIDRVGKILKQLKTKIFDQHAELEKLNMEVNESKVLQSQLEQLNLKLVQLQKQIEVNSKEVEAAKKEIKQGQDKVGLLEQDRTKLVQNNVDANNLSQEIKTCEKGLQDKIDDNVVQKIEQELEQVNQLLSADDKDLIVAQRAKVLEQVAQLVRELKTAKTTIKSLDNFIKGSFHIDKELKDNLNKQNDIVKSLQQVKLEKDTLLQQLGSVQEQLKKLKQIQIELTKLQKDLKKLEGEVQNYKALTSAFGKDGIQALLIEDAIPEIEQEANNLLGRLTDNQAQLFIESLRDLKSGGTRETLDIKISDAVGLRPYEMFSGGEAFRIDFALRIAISKLLARRAGTALQTLIIDEGFGSQDEEGLSHIMDAIYKIQDDFAKVIIVSHLPSMKEQFPVHFFVQKGAAGSTVDVIEQG